MKSTLTILSILTILTYVTGDTRVIISKSGRSNIIRDNIEIETECDKVVLGECFRIGAHYYTIDNFLTDNTTEENLLLERLTYMRYIEGRVAEVCNSKIRLSMENNKIKIQELKEINNENTEYEIKEYNIGEIVIKCENNEMTIIENNKREWKLTSKDDEDVFYNYWYTRSDNYSVANDELYTTEGVWKLLPKDEIVVKLLDNKVLEYEVYRSECNDDISKSECPKYLGRLKCNDETYTIYDKNEISKECEYSLIPK